MEDKAMEDAKEALEELDHSLPDIAKAVLAIAEDYYNDLGIIDADRAEVVDLERLITALTNWKEGL